MKLIDSIIREPCRVAFGRRSGGAISLALLREQDSVFLNASDGQVVEFGQANGAVAGMLSAADKAALDRVVGNGAAAEGLMPGEFASRAEAAAATIPPAVQQFRVAGHAAAGDGGHARYARAAAAPPHPLAFQSADGAWWEFQPPASGSIDVRAAGVFAANADNSAGLLALGAFLRQDRERHWHLHFTESGQEYRYLENHWLIGVGRVSVWAHGCVMRCIQTAAQGLNRNALYTPMSFYDSGLGRESVGRPAVNDRHYSGEPIASAAAGDTTVTLIDPLRSANLAVGAWVMLHGYDQQNAGFPPNMRYVQRAVVTAIDPATGVVTLDRPLRYTLDSRWSEFAANHIDGTEFWGAPRILNLERGADRFNVIRELNIHGGIWRGPEGTADEHRGINVAGCLVHRVYDADFRVYFFSDCAEYHAERLMVRETCEGDKLVEQATLKNCELTNLTQNTGIQSLVIEGCRLSGQISLGSEATLMRGNRIVTTSGTSTVNPVGWRQRRVSFAGNEWQATVSPLTFGINVSNAWSFTADGVLGTAIRVGAAQQHAGAGLTGVVARNVDYGTFLVNAAGTNYGFVNELYWDGTDLVIGGTWTAPFGLGEEIFYNNPQRVVFDDRIDIAGLPRDSIVGGAGVETDEARSVLRIDTGGLSFDNLTGGNSGQIIPSGAGWISGVRIWIDRPYTGASVNAAVNVVGTPADGSAPQIIASVDPVTAGRREVFAGGATGGQPGDSLQPQWIGMFVKSVRLRLNEMGLDAPSARPEVRIEVETVTQRGTR